METSIVIAGFGGQGVLFAGQLHLCRHGCRENMTWILLWPGNAGRRHIASLSSATNLSRRAYRLDQM